MPCGRGPGQNKQGCVSDVDANCRHAIKTHDQSIRSDSYGQQNWIRNASHAFAGPVCGQAVHVCEPALTRVCVNDSRTLSGGPPQCPGGLWVVGRGFGFWLCLSLCADITVLMAPNPSFYCTQHFLYKTPTHAHTHAASNANLAKKSALVQVSIHACMHVCMHHTRQLG